MQSTDIQRKSPKQLSLRKQKLRLAKLTRLRACLKPKHMLTIL
jgi:hypothetical protein